jgi:hypothetical protein
MRCPVCLQVTIERTEADIVVKYDVEDWKRHCRCSDRGSPALCEDLRPTILRLLLTDCKDAPLGAGEPREG